MNSLNRNVTKIFLAENSLKSIVGGRDHTGNKYMEEPIRFLGKANHPPHITKKNFAVQIWEVVFIYSFIHVVYKYLEYVLCATLYCKRLKKKM